MFRNLNASAKKSEYQYFEFEGETLKQKTSPKVPIEVLHFGSDTVLRSLDSAEILSGGKLTNMFHNHMGKLQC